MPKVKTAYSLKRKKGKNENKVSVPETCRSLSALTEFDERADGYPVDLTTEQYEEMGIMVVYPKCHQCYFIVAPFTGTRGRLYNILSEYII